MESPVEVILPTGERAGLDGNLALQRIILSPEANHLLIDYALYLQMAKEDGKPIKDRATALLVFGFKAPPTATLNGKEWKSDGATVEINGETAYIIPLFDVKAGDLMAGLKERYAAAMALITEEK